MFFPPLIIVKYYKFKTVSSISGLSQDPSNPEGPKLWQWQGIPHVVPAGILCGLQPHAAQEVKCLLPPPLQWKVEDHQETGKEND